MIKALSQPPKKQKDTLFIPLKVMHRHPTPTKRHRRSMARAQWEERRTLDGVAYYYNKGTDALTWVKPDELKSDAERSDSDVYHFEYDKSKGWIPKRGKGKWAVTKLELQRHEDDVVMLEHINEAMISHNIRKRYEEDKIYTWCGASKTVLISVNPFKWDLPLYTPAQIERHRKPPANRRLEPHVYDIANHALNTLMLEGKNQSILISGESGAGKTECAKQCFSFLAETAGSNSNVEQLILAANPILEAFGNAKTLRNNNSSRFGKWVAIDFDPYGKIVSAKAQSFLLEKIRVVSPAKGERNFHIFYQLFSSSRMRQKYMLTSPEKYRYLGVSGCFEADGVNDAKEFEDTQKSMKLLGFTPKQQSWVFKTVAAILHLGSIRFKSSRIGNAEGCEVKSMKRIEKAADLLGVPVASLKKAVTYRSITVGRKKTMIPLNPSQAVDACDALSKSIYDRMFLWLVKTINAATSSGGKSSKFIGVLDIFGFEIMQTNSFEQLCINYTNEKLQQFFNKHTFKEEESVYKSEEIEYTKIKFIDNQPVLDLIEKKRKGLLPLLDDAVRMPQGSDEKWIKNADSVHKKSKPYVVPKPRRDPLAFTVNHYAGSVDYTAKEFLQRNKDPLHDDLALAMNESSSKLLRGLFEDDERTGGQRQTVSERFRKNLRKLMKMLETTSPCYIRCVKPNHAKRPDMYVAPLCIEQLRNAGVFEAVAIRKGGFPFRKTHEEFAEHYSCVDPKKRSSSHLKTCKKLLRFMSKKTTSGLKDIQIGTTSILYRAPEHRFMELLRNLALGKAVRKFQAAARGFICRAYYRRLKKVAKRLNSLLESDDVNIETLDKTIKKCVKIIGSFSRCFEFEPGVLVRARALKRSLEEWVDIEKALLEMASIPTEQCYARLFAVVEKMDDLKKRKIPMTKSQQKKRKDAKKRLRDCASARIDPEAEKAIYLLDTERMKSVLEEAREMRYASEETSEIERLLALDEETMAKMQLKKAIELKDPIRRVNREIFLKMKALKSSMSWMLYQKYAHLKTPEEFQSESWAVFGRDKIGETMLVHVDTAIHTSLCRDVPTTEVKNAKLIFKNILMFMGEKRYNGDVNALAAEIVTIAMNSPSDSLRTEAYVQLIKQLTKNGSPQSERNGWRLMGLLLQFVKPSEAFEDYLLCFLLQRKGNNGSQAYISTYHELSYRNSGESYEPPLRPPSLNEVARLMKNVQTRTVRSRYSAREIVVQHDVSRVRGYSSSAKKKRTYVDEEEEMSRLKISSTNHYDDDDDEDEDEEPPLPVRREEQHGDEPIMYAAYDFEAMDETTVGLTVDDKIKLLAEPDDDGWVYVENMTTGQTGYAPTDYLEKR